MLFLNRNKFFSRYLPMILSVILLVVGFGSYFLLKNATPAKSAWYSSANGTWNYRQKITIDHNKVGHAISLVDHNKCSGDNCTTGAMNTSGATLLVATVNCYSQDVNTAVVSDSKSNTWHKLTGVNSGASNGHAVIWYSYDKAGAALSLGSSHTISVASCSLGAINVSAYSGTLTGSDPLDSQTSFANSAGGILFNPGVITPRQSNELFVTAIGGNITSFAINSGFTISDTVTYGSFTGGGSAYHIQGAIASVNPTWTLQCCAVDGGVVMASFKASPTNSTQTNFPVLVSTTNVQFKDITNGGHVGKSDGSDIVFTSGDQLTKLNHEIESYASSTGQLIAWVNVPSLSPTVDTTLYMYYGNAAETGNEQSATGVWDSNYKGVWHFNEGSGATVNDSTSNALTGTNTGTTRTTSMWGTGAVSYSGSDVTSMGHPGSIADLPSWTYSAWFNTTINSVNETVMQKSNDKSFGPLASSFNGQYYGGYVNWSSKDASIATLVGGVIQTNIWYYGTLTYTGGVLSLYKDGQLIGTDTTNGSHGSDSSNDLLVGSGRFGAINGKITEPRLSSVARSTDWVRTEYNNQNSPSTFISWGGEETQPTAQVNGGWYNAAWTYRKKIIINHQQVSGTSTLSNFPVLVSIASDPLLAYTGSGGHVASSTGGDILFTSANGVLLNFEREKYVSATGELEAWVQVPTLSPTTDTVLYLYYGNASAVDQQNAAATWDSNYKVIYHMSDNTANTTITNSIGSNNATNNANTNTKTTAGKIGSALAYNGSTDYSVSASNIVISANAPSTFSAWVNSDLADQGSYNRILETTYFGNGYLGVDTNGTSYEFLVGSDTTHNVGGTVGLGNWQYVVGVYDGTKESLYIDGSLVGTPFTISTTITSVPLFISRYSSSSLYYWTGKIDDVRVSTVNRSADWIKTEYNNQSAPTSFETVAGEETQSTTTYNANWYSGAWAYRKPIVIDHAKVNTATGTTTPLTNFPVLINITDNDLKNNASSTGADILFTSSDGKTKLNHEIETYSTSTGQLIAWVQIPSLVSTSDTTIYMYFGNSAATSQQNASAVWDSNYKGVWHLANVTGGAGSVLDSTINANNGTPGSPANITGKIDGAANFVSASTQSISVGTDSSLNPTSAITYSAWVYSTTNVNGMTALARSPSAAIRYSLSTVTAPSKWQCQVAFNSNGVKTLLSNTFSDSNWYYVSCSYDGSFFNMYVNGSLVSTTTVASDTISTSTSDGTYIGKNSSGATGYFNGNIDDVRVSGIARSADWIATEYNNQSLPSTFYAVGGLGKENGNTAKTTVTSRGAGLSWYNTGGTWTNRRQIIINHNYMSQQATTTFSNFPFLFSSVDNELKYTGSGGKVALSNGNDILFTAADGTTKLDHELESYSSTTGTTIAWVRIPLLSATQDTVIYLYYGNASSGNQQNATGVWNSNYKGVWHLSNGSSLSTTDSTGLNTATNNGVTATTGQIDGAGGLNGSTQYIDLGSSSNITFTGAVTYSCWVKPTSIGSFYLPLSGGAGGPELILHDNSGSNANTFYFQVAGGAIGQANANQAVTNTWYHVVGTYDNVTNINIYVNGSLQLTQNIGSGKNSGTPSNPNIGRRSASVFYWPGTIDECRISNVDRSADWIKTEYNNQNSPQTFYVLSGASNAQSRPANVPLIKSRGGVKFH